MLNSSPLEKAHENSGARFSPFAGWNLPLHYTSPLEEHRCVRNSAGLFDISHMGRLSLLGPGVGKFLESITTINAIDLKTGGCRYGLLLDSKGFIVDDVYLFRMDVEEYIFVVNASNREAILEIFFSQTLPSGITFRDTTFDTAMIALQGPKVSAVWMDIFQEELPKPRNLVWRFKDVVVSRTGYTGEYGVEIIVDKDRAEEWWNLLLSHELVTPAGLASRDSLRFESGYMLYGHELNRDLRPCDTNLSWAVRKKRLDQLLCWEILKDCEAEQTLIWFQMLEKAVPRQGYRVIMAETNPSENIGTVCSGMFAPTIEKFAGSALVTSKKVPQPGDSISIEIRGTLKEARVINPPLYQQG